jgi:hypothetical protein
LNSEIGEIGPWKHPKSTDFTYFISRYSRENENPETPRDSGNSGENFVVRKPSDIFGISGNPGICLENTSKLRNFHCVHTAAAGNPQNPEFAFPSSPDISGIWDFPETFRDFRCPDIFGIEISDFRNFQQNCPIFRDLRELQFF